MVEEYIRLDISAPSETLPVLYGLLCVFPFVGLEEKESTVYAYMLTSTWEQNQADITYLLNQYGFPFRVQPYTEIRDWYHTWLEQLQPLWIAEDIVIHPFPEPPQPRQYKAARDILHIVPGTAFGTGHHATTRLAAQLLLSHLRPSTVWLDAGTGSGILAILAARRGAQRIYAVDNNPSVLEQACFNIIQNAVETQVIPILSDLEQIELSGLDGIVANLHAELLIRLVQRFFQFLKPGGVCIVSGILLPLETELVRVFEKVGFSIESCLREDEWSALSFRKQ